MAERAAFRLDGQVAMVTGGGRGIGAAIAKVFAASGASVAVANRTGEAAEQIADEIGAAGNVARAYTLDVGARDAIHATIERVAADFGRLDIVVHNAGVNPWSSVDAMTPEMLEETLAVNLKACFYLAQAAAPHLRRQGGGRILVTSSVTGPRVAMPKAAHYAASKGGVNGFIRAAALEYARDRITVNGVEPGFIAKPGRGTLLKDPERVQRITRYIPLGEMGVPEDVAYAMLYLASPAGRYVTGQTIVVDGGSTLPESPIFMSED
jgi:3-oxoacyl-[acyl-carrier protein] reductase